MIPKEEFAEKLNEIFDFGYNYRNENGINEVIKEQFLKAFRVNIVDRINILYESAKYVIIEEDYVESEWKEMISKHYIHSAYARSLKQRVLRIHFLCDDEFVEENYLGFITLRPIRELAIALSFIYVNWKHSFFDNSTSYVMTYKKDVHYLGKKLTISTYPFFAQDTIVTCCADANVVMLTKYYSNKYKSAFTGKLAPTFIKTSKKHQLPKKVNAALLQGILTEVGIPFRVKRFQTVRDYDDKQWDRIQKYIDVYIESAIPVVLGIDGHVVQLIGHIEFEDDMEKRYIVYDDSGYLENICLKENEQATRKFTYLLSVNEIRQYYEKKKLGEDRFFILMPEHERVYIDFERYQIYLLLRIQQYASVDLDEESIYSKIFNKEGNLKEEVVFRNMLVDNSFIKSFLDQQRSKGQDEYIENLLRKELPHFLWYTEIELNGDRMCICADPTMYYETRNIEDLFLGEKPIGILGEKYLSLLTRGGSS